MKFDTARVVEGAGTFAFVRGAGSAGEVRAAEAVAEGLERLGLRVERVPVQGSRLPGLAAPWLGWLGLGLWATGLEVLTRFGARWPVRLALAIGALFWLRLTAVEGFEYLRRFARRVGSTNVVAWREVEGPAPVRIVFLTVLESFDPRRAHVPRWLTTPVVGLFLAGEMVADLTIQRNPLHFPAWSGMVFLGLLWLTIAARIVRLIRHTSVPGPCDNRTGLAVLLELARTWPRATDARIETRFVATGGTTLGRAGLDALARAMAEQWPPRPTLVIEWLAPGIGPGLALIEQWTGGLAAAAARDLWIPHHVVHPARSRHAQWPFGDGGPGYVGMVGSAIDRAGAHSNHPDTAIDGAAIGRAAQLATEVALRWARTKAPPEDQPSRARSSQNPG